MHTESPLSAAQMLETMPTDEAVEGLFAMAAKPKKRDDDAPNEYGSGVV